MSKQLFSRLAGHLRDELPHLADDEISSLAEIVSRLIDAYEPERVYLFGSKARGDHGPDSDFDLMVVVAKTSEPGYRLAQNAHSLLWGVRTAADVLIWDRDRFDSRLHLKASLPS